MTERTSSPYKGNGPDSSSADKTWSDEELFDQPWLRRRRSVDAIDEFTVFMPSAVVFRSLAGGTYGDGEMVTVVVPTTAELGD